MPNEFEKLKSVSAWRSKLDELLRAARESAQEEDLDARLAVADRLTTFIVCNPLPVAGDPATLEYDDMDRIAKEAHDALLLGTIQERVAGIMSRTAELATLRKSIDARAEANRQAAASIRLEKVRRVVDATTEAVTALKALQGHLESSDDVNDGAKVMALLKDVDKAITSIQALRNDVETVLT